MMKHVNTFVHKTALRSQIGYPVALGRNYDKVIPTMRESYNNAGDAYTEKGTYERERHDDERVLIDRVCDMWKVDTKRCGGYTTAGGSEGNLQGLWMAREQFPGAVLYFSDQIHYSIKKMAKILQLQTVVIPSDETGAIDLEELTHAIDYSRPIIVLANIGSTFLGGIDDVKSIREILGDGAYIHADAAFFGFVMPQLFPGYDGYKYMDSISVSSHKWPGVPFPGGGKFGGVGIGYGAASGGNHSPTGASNRIMWQEDGGIIAYIYPPEGVPQSIPGLKTDGFGGGFFKDSLAKSLKLGSWNKIELGTKMNTFVNGVPQGDGECYVSVNGVKRTLFGINWSRSPDLKISQINMGNFFGGPTPSPVEQFCYFKNFQVGEY